MSQPVTECASCGFRTPQVDSPDGDLTAPKFCGSCGARLADDTGQTPHATALPSSLSDAHKRPIIVLMADVSGYSGLSETLELDWLYEVLREVLAQLSECVLEHGGHIDKYVGDEVVALFGYPRAIEDGADRALHAALAMHKRMADLNRTNVHLVGKVLELHIGINAGVVMSGPVGSGESEGTTVIGDVVNVAKRLESAAPAGSTYLSQSVVDRLRGRYSLELLGPMGLKGRDGPVVTYRLADPLQRGPAPAPDEAPVLARPRLRAEIDASLKQPGTRRPCAFLVGGPGVGKTTAAHGWLASARQSGARVLEVVCTSVTAEIPYWALGELLSEFGLRAGPEGLPIDERIRSGLRALLGDELSSYRAATDLVEQQRATLAPGRRQPDLVHLRTLDRLLHSLSDQGPVALLFDNAEHVDSPTARLLSWLPATPPARRDREAWLFAARRKTSLPLAAAWGGSPIEVGPLSERESRQLLELVPGHDDWSPTIKRSIIRDGQGVPQRLVGLARWIRSREPGTDHGMSGLSIQELALAEVEALRSPLPTVLQACAVIGEPVLPELIEELVPGGVGSVHNLAALLEGGYLQPTAHPKHYRLGDRIMAETLHDMIPAGDRARLHGRLANYLLNLGPDQANVHLLARHAYLAGWGERAMPFLNSSAEAYFRDYSIPESIRAAERALEVASGAESPADWYPERVRALLHLANALHVSGDPDRAGFALDEAEVLAEETDDPTLRAEVLIPRAHNASMRQDWDGALHAYQAAEELWRGRSDPTREAHALLGAGFVLLNRNDVAGAAESFQRALHVGRSSPKIVSAALNNLAVLATHQGDVDRAEALVLQAIRAARDSDDRYAIGRGYTSLAQTLLAAGRVESAVHWCEEARRIADEIDDPEAAFQAGGVLGQCLLELGRSRDAELVLDEVALYRQGIRDEEAIQVYSQCVERIKASGQD